jgi:hypothetical protein
MGPNVMRSRYCNTQAISVLAQELRPAIQLPQEEAQ